MTRDPPLVETDQLGPPGPAKILSAGKIAAGFSSFGRTRFFTLGISGIPVIVDRIGLAGTAGGANAVQNVEVGNPPDSVA